MPGFTFPTVGPLGLGSPPSRPSNRFGPRYYDPLRLPLLPLRSLRASLDPGYLAFPYFRSFRFPGGGVHPSTPGLFCFPVCLSRCSPQGDDGPLEFPGYPCAYMPCSRTPVVSSRLAISSPGLCFPVQPDRQLSPARARLSSQTTTMNFSELCHTACTLVTPGFTHTLTGYACRFTSDSAAHLVWWDLHDCPVLTQWVTLTNFTGSFPFPWS